jgi:signal transduction histidine kinase
LSVLLAVLLVGGIAYSLRAAGRAMRLSEMKSDFVSNVSHELRTPLAAIRVHAEFLRTGRATESDKVREYGHVIENESRRLSRLIDNILDFARIESGRKTYNFDTVDLEMLVDAVVIAFRERAEQAGFTVDYAEPDPPLPSLRGDGEAIRQALGNLLDNALKYSGDGRRIVVALGREGDCAVVSVADEGPGIPREEQARIFDRFHRVARGAVHDVKGSGLGLAIVSHVAEAHGGRAEVESEPGRGSRFTLRLPFAGPPVAAGDGGAAGGDERGGG